MRGPKHVRLRRAATIALATGVLGAAMGVTPVVAAPGSELPACSTFSPTAIADAVISSPWQALLDKKGAVTGHAMTLRRHSVDTVLRVGRRGFSLQVATGRTLLGERSDNQTEMVMVDTSRGCRLWGRSIGRLAYALRSSEGDSPLQMTLHEPDSRAYLGTLLLDRETGATEALIDGECTTNCVPNDGDVPDAAFGPAGAARPVPNFSGGAWPKDRTLAFSWRSGAAPPDWARSPLKSAADDAYRSAKARSPRFVHRAGEANSVRYGGAFPTFCGGIACASRVLPSHWGIWLRPHGADLAWGTLRWCQKASGSGCFDIRRVMLHELGHVAGLHHPSSAGFRLTPHETVMHAVSPAKPQPGSTRHAFGRCDVATLQELYDVPNNRTAISTCNAVDSRLTLSRNKASVAQGGSVKLEAVLRVANKAAYRQLSNNPLNARSVKLKFRRAGSNDAWTTAWMRSRNSSGRYDLTITPQASWEFKATFPAPSHEGLRFSRSDIVKVKVQR